MRGPYRTLAANLACACSRPRTSYCSDIQPMKPAMAAANSPALPAGKFQTSRSLPPAEAWPDPLVQLPVPNHSAGLDTAPCFAHPPAVHTKDLLHVE
jgi:hypothetical protein